MPLQRTPRRKANLTAAETRKRVIAAIQKLSAQKDSEEAQKNIARLQAVLEKKDEELEGTNLNEEIDGMELDEVEDGADQDSADQTDAGKDNTEKSNVNKRKRPREEEKDIGKPKPIFKIEPLHSETPLFVPEEDSESEFEEDLEYGRPLYYRPSPKPEDGVKTVGWAGGRRTQYINQYGPKNAAKHRLESSAESAQYEDDKPESEKVNNINIRYGDEVLPNDKFRFTKRYIIAIYKVVWESASTNNSETDLNFIDPKLIEKHWPTTYIFVAWDVNGITEKKWEPRQALRAK
jgi:hypothetical protein